MSWSKPGGLHSSPVILTSAPELMSDWRYPHRMYVNIVENAVCVSLCHRTHGEGEGLMASSPAEPAGRRQGQIGHLPFWVGSSLRERVPRVMGTFLVTKHNFSLPELYQLKLRTHGQDSQRVTSCVCKAMAHQEEVEWNADCYIYELRGILRMPEPRLRKCLGPEICQ